MTLIDAFQEPQDSLLTIFILIMQFSQPRVRLSLTIVTKNITVVHLCVINLMLMQRDPPAKGHIPSQNEKRGRVYKGTFEFLWMVRLSISSYGANWIWQAIEQICLNNFPVLLPCIQWCRFSSRMSYFSTVVLPKHTLYIEVREGEPSASGLSFGPAPVSRHSSFLSLCLFIC